MTSYNRNISKSSLVTTLKIVAHDGIADATIPEIYFSRKLQFVSQVPAERAQTEDNIQTYSFLTLKPKQNITFFGLHSPKSNTFKELNPKKFILFGNSGICIPFSNPLYFNNCTKSLGDEYIPVKGFLLTYAYKQSKECSNCAGDLEINPVPNSVEIITCNHGLS